MTPESETAADPTPLDPEVRKCPYDYYAALHASGEAARDEGPVGWVVPGHGDLSSIGTDTKRFSSMMYGEEGPKLTGVSPEPYNDEVNALIAGMEPLANALFCADPPAHTRQRVLATKALNAERVRKMEPMIHETVDDLIDGFIDDGRCEFITQFAIWLPLTMVSNAIGVDRADMKDFKRWTDHIAVGLVEQLDNDQRAEVLRNVQQFEEYMLPRIEERRSSPRDDLLSALVNEELDLDELEGQEIAGPRQLTNSEILSIVSQILAAGNHTTTDLLGNTMVSLLSNPEAMAAVRADHGLIPNALEESLRLDAPVQCTYRITTQDSEVRDTTIPAASMVAVAWGAAGHDPEVFPDPEKFDISRSNVKKHLSFGHGPHFCVGNNLARVEARIGFERLLTRLDDIRLADGPPPERRDQFAFSGYGEINLEFSKSDAG